MAELYILTSPSGKSYIGYTKETTKKRFEQHVYHANRSKDFLIGRAIKKHGAENFQVRTLLTGPDHILLQLEDLFIMSLGTLAPAGYNTARGGGGFGSRIEMSPPIKTKCAESAKARWARMSPAERSDLLRRQSEGRKKPGMQARAAEVTRARWRDPIQRDKMLSTQQAARDRKRSRI